MFEKILGGLLNRLLGDYVEGFDSNNLNLSLWSGEVNIENVRLKKEILVKLGLPISIKYSFIRNLRLKIPWKSLTSSKT
jgi:vacuolar protein sorting-associated protein 13A/C